LAFHPERMLLRGRLFQPAGLSALGADRHPDAAEGRADRGDLHAHGLGEAGAYLRHPGAAAADTGVPDHHGAGIRLHLAYPHAVVQRRAVGSSPCGPGMIVSGFAALRFWIFKLSWEENKNPRQRACPTAYSP